MIFMPKIKDVSRLNPCEALGLVPGRDSEAVEEDRIIDL
jgi:hypothetical protein